MRPNRILLCLLISSLAQAEPPSPPTAWRFGGRTEKMVLVREKSFPFPVRVSEQCSASDDQREKCAALKAVDQALDPEFRKRMRVLIPGSRGGAEPGSRICRGVFQAWVELAEDDKGNRNAFCTFNDGSRLSTGSLSSVWDHSSLAAGKKGK